MAFTQTDLDNINAAIATGEMTVEVNGRRVVYRSIADLKDARALIKDELAAANPVSPRRGNFTVRFSTARD